MSASKSHYEVLGVARESDAAEVKRAFRRKAEQAHPDKVNGNHGEMAAINQAYEVLSDPDRRLLYDRTGKDKEAPLDDRVNALIMQVFAEALSKDVTDILTHARKCLESARDQVKQNQKQAADSIAKLKSRRGKIKTKPKVVNAFYLVADQQLLQMTQGVEELKSNLKVCEGALKAIKAYESDETVPVQTVSYVMAYTGSPSSW